MRQLRAQGQPVGPERVRHSLHRQGLRPVYKRPYRVTTGSAHSLPVAPNLLDRRFDGWRPNQAWVSDITFVATDEGWLFLAAILDLSSRRIVGWSMSERMQADRFARPCAVLACFNRHKALLAVSADQLVYRDQGDCKPTD
ncbi:hypothetical protein Tamer19_69870 [Cupriavidus sp. TA19]|nr:hypothetical protein Tamer19_69870 [Cupriavidus sp. TA19]